MVNFCVQILGSELLGTINGTEFIDYLNNYQILHEGSALSSYFNSVQVSYYYFNYNKILYFC